MSDTKLRELERRWKETGSIDDEAAYLLEQVRVGDLTTERLELAAYCGHAAAGRATGLSVPVTSAYAWVDGLARWGKEACVVAAVEASSSALGHWTGRPQEIDDALVAARGWLNGTVSAEECQRAAANAEPLIFALESETQVSVLAASLYAARASATTRVTEVASEAAAAALGLSRIVTDREALRLLTERLLAFAFSSVP